MYLDEYLQAHPELGEPLVAIPDEGLTAIGLLSLVTSIVGVVSAQPAVVVGGNLAGLAAAQLAVPRNIGIGMRIGAIALPTVVVVGLLTWWAVARRAKKGAS